MDSKTANSTHNHNTPAALVAGVFFRYDKTNGTPSILLKQAPHNPARNTPPATHASADQSP